MTPVPFPAYRTAYTSGDPQHPHRVEYRARPQNTHFITRSIGLAAHLGALGIEVERVVLRDQRVGWRVPMTAKQDARRYEQTHHALDSGRRHAEAAMASQVTDLVGS